MRFVVDSSLEWCGLLLTAAWSGAVCDVTVLSSLTHLVHIGRCMTACWQQQTRVHKGTYHAGRRSKGTVNLACFPLTGEFREFLVFS